MNKKIIFHLLLIINCNLLFCQNPLKEIGFESDLGGFYGWNGYIGGEQGDFYSLEPGCSWPANWEGPKVLYNNSSYPDVLPNSKFVFNTTDITGNIENVRFARIYKGMPSDERNRIETVQEINGVLYDSRVNNKIKLESPNGSQHIVRLGNSYDEYFSERLSYTFTVTDSTKYILYNYAIVLEDPGHSGRPYFYVEIENEDCSKTFYYADNKVFADLSSETYNYIKNGSEYKQYYYYKDWSANLIDLSSEIGKTLTLTFITSDCGGGAHAGYAYFDAMFINSSIQIQNEKCKGNNLEISCAATGVYKNETYLWNFGDGATSSVAKPTHTYEKEGVYLVSLTITNPDVAVGCQTRTVQDTIVITKKCSTEEPTCTACSSCPSGFAPIPGKRYVFSAWVKDSLALTQGVSTYQHCSVLLTFELADLTQKVDTLYPSGSIIDGWQRIQQEFTVPDHACKLHIGLNNDGDNQNVFFDDVRVSPFNSSMKSYVYDPLTLRLAAELDDNNYATFYEYDEDGALIRVKKETEKGVMTIKEAHQSKPKK
jgi:hypothetical protein